MSSSSENMKILRKTVYLSKTCQLRYFQILWQQNDYKRPQGPKNDSFATIGFQTLLFVAISICKYVVFMKRGLVGPWVFWDLVGPWRP